MDNLNEVTEQQDNTTQPSFWQTVQKQLEGMTLKKLRGGLLVVIGYLLSPLCWWNDLIFNLPVAYVFGYICSLFSETLFTPGLIAGYWLSNIIGILMMQFGAADMLQQPKEQNLKKELFMGVASSTVYTLLILALMQLKILDAPALLSELSSLDLNSLLQLVTLNHS